MSGISCCGSGQNNLFCGSGQGCCKLCHSFLYGRSNQPCWHISLPKKGKDGIPINDTKTWSTNSQKYPKPYFKVCWQFPGKQWLWNLKKFDCGFGVLSVLVINVHPTWVWNTSSYNFCTGDTFLLENSTRCIPWRRSQWWERRHRRCCIMVSLLFGRVQGIALPKNFQPLQRSFPAKILPKPLP